MRKLAALEALSRYGNAQGRMLDSITIAPNQWPTSALIDWIGILKRVDDVPQRERRIDEARADAARAADFQGTVLTLQHRARRRLVVADGLRRRQRQRACSSRCWTTRRWQRRHGAHGARHHGAPEAAAPGHHDRQPWGGLALDSSRRGSRRRRSTGRQRGVTSAASKCRASRRTASRRARRQAAQRSSPWPASAGDAQRHAERQRQALAHTCSSCAAVPLNAPLLAGYAIKRTVTPVEQKDKAGYSRGDVFRVTLEIEAQCRHDLGRGRSTRSPAARRILGCGLGRDAQIATQGEKREGTAWPAFIERSSRPFAPTTSSCPKAASRSNTRCA